MSYNPCTASYSRVDCSSLVGKGGVNYDTIWCTHCLAEVKNIRVAAGTWSRSIVAEYDVVVQERLSPAALELESKRSNTTDFKL